MRPIDADALKKLLQNLAHDDWNQITCTTWAEAFEEVADMIDGTPTADVVERKRGKWENICSLQNWQYTYEHYRCSNCGIPAECAFRYCPNCGAEMRERRDDE